MNFLANLLTSLSLAFGFISVIFSLEGQFTYASWAIILAFVFDGFDGQIARKNPIPSQFGKELDSLVDVVSFGIAPAILGYIFVYHDFYPWATVTLFIYLFCSVMRLAKYNITPKAKGVNYFNGLPITASGGILAVFVIVYRKGDQMMLPGFIPNIFFPKFVPVMFLILVLILSYLMVSRIKYLNLDGLKQFFGNKLKLIVLALGGLLCAASFFKKAGIVLLALFLIYLLFSPFVVKRLNHI